jgi:hypothetical protein
MQWGMQWLLVRQVSVSRYKRFEGVPQVGFKQPFGFDTKLFTQFNELWFCHFS